MTLGLINSAWFGRGAGTAEGIRLTKEIGFDTIDIFADPLETDADKRRRILDTCHEVGLPIRSVVGCALGEHAAGLNLHIAEMSRFLDAVASPAVGANIDISHLVLGKDPPERIRELAGRIVHVHLSDGDGKVHGDLPRRRGSVRFEGFLSELRDAGFDGSISIELEYSPEPGRIVEWVREAYSATDRSLSEQNLRG